MATGSSHKAVLTTLQLLESVGKEGADVLPASGERSETRCLLCDDVYQLADLNPLLKHLVEDHRFVIAGVRMIADFKKYAEYWRNRLKEKSVSHFCSVILTNTGPDDSAPQERFNLLCDILPEDKKLRQDLQKEKLDQVLKQQSLERDGRHFQPRGCLFCKEHFTGNRSLLLNHMATEHNFNIGKPDNIVYVDEVIDTLQDKLNKLQCLYCENTFKDRLTLKEHMRKKNHKRIKATNRSYDKFYIINYLEFGKKWEELQKDVMGDDESPDQSEHEDDWSEWKEEEEGEAGMKVVCLFCVHTSTSSPDLLIHMNHTHNFNLTAIKERHRLNFYQQIKLINYIRRQVYQKCCIYCDLQCDTSEELCHHMTTTGHFSQVPDIKVWDQPQYFFPTYEDDALLYALDSTTVSSVQDLVTRDDDDNEEEECSHVYAEESDLLNQVLLHYSQPRNNDTQNQSNNNRDTA